MRPVSLTLRLTLLFSVTAAVILAVFGWVINRSTENHFEAGDVAELRLVADAVESALAGAHTEDALTSVERRFADILVGHHRASLYITGKDQRPIYASPGPDLSTFVRSWRAASGDTYIHQWNHANHSYRVLIRHAAELAPRVGQPYTMAVAVQIDYHLRFLEHFRKTLWLMIGASIGIMGLLGWIAVRQGHAPLRDIVARIRHMSANDLNTRLSPEAFPPELAALAIAFNGMLQRVDEAFVRLSDFNADIAHELRTPITNLMTQTQVALSRARTIDQYRETLYSNIEECERMAQMVNDMLFLAQADNHPLTGKLSDIDLSNEVHALFDYYDGWAEERGVTLSLKGTATVSADRLMLQRALGNLLSNAIRHTKAGETVRVELHGSNEDDASIVVENPGTEIPPEHLPRLFDRFYRIDPARHREGGGSGLGLAIVKSIVEAHGGNISVTSAAGRTRFQIILPKPSTFPAGRRHERAYREST
jgi:two-component system heavy metal sensor histidine kinase CusS